jgi:hypothetical protein
MNYPEQTEIQNIQEYLINSRGHLQEICAPLLQQREQLLEQHNHVFTKDIEDQFKYALTVTISDDLAKNLAVPTDVALVVLERINLLDYILQNVFEDEDTIIEEEF